MTPVPQAVTITRGTDEDRRLVTGEHEPELRPATDAQSILAFMFSDIPPARRVSIRRFARYCSVSGVSTVTSITVLGLLVGVLDMQAIWANVIATTIATIPSFELNRRWVWAHNGRRSILRQALPYFLLSFTGLILSTFAVHLASDATTHSTRLLHTAAVEMGNLGSYGLLWILQFVLCDRILFRSRVKPLDPEARYDRADRDAGPNEAPAAAYAAPEATMSSGVPAGMMSSWDRSESCSRMQPWEMAAPVVPMRASS
jgi:putative flippase GtrA